MRWKMCLVYLDDVRLFSHNQDEHLEHLETVLNLLKDAGIKFKMKKCFFVKKKLSTLATAFDREP